MNREITAAIAKLWAQQLRKRIAKTPDMEKREAWEAFAWALEDLAKDMGVQDTIKVEMDRVTIN